MKFNCTNQTELEALLAEQAKCTAPLSEFIIAQVHPTSGRAKFKDVRKISVGLSKKDIITFRSKQKSAFYNCFVLILRIFHDEVYREIHVKVFNTGKLEIPGIQDARLLKNVLDTLTNILTPFIVTPASPEALEVREGTSETVLINSNFTCGYFVNREKFYRILRFKYNINCNYDPCTYPGIQCEFYHDSSRADEAQNGCQPGQGSTGKITVVWFMIFRTGSVLIVGKCTEHVLNLIYRFLVNIFDAEFAEIFGGINAQSNVSIEAEAEVDVDELLDDEGIIKPAKRKVTGGNSTRKVRRQLVTMNAVTETPSN